MRPNPFTIALSLVACCWVTAAFCEDPTRPVPLIFDTDIGNDCDDVMALAMIHSLQSRGECELLAVTITKDHPLAAKFTDAVNTFYRRGDVPIGVCDSGVTPEQKKYIGLAQVRDGESARFPSNLNGKNQPIPAVDLLRKTLAGQNDGSVVIAQVGFSTNLANLLRSGPDQHSPLSGPDLVTQKVRLLSIMAGAFTQIPDGKGNLYDHKEYNVVKDLPSAQYLAMNWPTDIVWSGFEIGLNLRYPHESIEKDFAYVKHHPVSEAYVLYNPPPHDRPTWDLTSVLYAVRPERGYFEVSDRGRVIVDEQGLTEFSKQDGGRDRFLIIPDKLKPRTTEALVQLTTEPPH